MVHHIVESDILLTVDGLPSLAAFAHVGITLIDPTFISRLLKCLFLLPRFGYYVKKRWRKNEITCSLPHLLLSRQPRFRTGSFCLRLLRSLASRTERYHGSTRLKWPTRHLLQWEAI